MVGVQFQRRLRTMACLASLSGTMFFVSTEPFEYQDAVGLLLLDGGSAPRWAGFVKPAPHGSSLAPTFTYGEIGAGNGDEGPEIAMGVADDDGETLISTRVIPRKFALIETDATNRQDRLNRRMKGDRLTTVRPSVGSSDFVAGSVYHMASPLESNEKARMPRVAFVKPVILKKSKDDRDRISPRAIGQPLSLLANAAKTRKEQHMMMVNGAAAASVSLATAYASDPTESLQAPFNAIFGPSDPELPRDDALSPEDGEAPGKGPLAALGLTGPGGLFHSWFSNKLPASVNESSQKRCLAAAVYFEARSEPWAGQVAVAQVVLNRVKNPSYPDSICGVVYQNKNWRNRCQFSFACDGARDSIRDKNSWRKAQNIAREVIAGKHWLDKVGDSTHYHATYVRPRWAPRMTRKGKIGQHIFFRSKRGGWS